MKRGGGERTVSRLKMRKGSDFNVETNGECFLCLKRIYSPPSLVKLEVEAGTGNTGIESECRIPSFSSFQRFSRYLNMDLKKVLNEKESIPQRLLTKVERPKLKVELCKDCGNLNDKFSKLHGLLEKIEMELNFYVNAAHEKLVISNATINPDKTAKLKSSDKSMDGFKGKQAIAKVLRKEAMEKCSSKVKLVVPQLKLQNLTMKQLNLTEKKFKMKRISQQSSEEHFSDPCIEITEVKLETHNSIPYNDAYLGGFSSDSTSEDECSRPVISSIEDNIEMKIERESSVNLSLGETQAKTRSSLGSKTDKWKCSICPNKCFKTKKILYVHNRIKHMNVAYKCDSCGKKFRHSNQRRSHFQTVHLGMEFKCKVCDKNFLHERNLQRHSKESSCGEGGQLHACNLCKMKFRRKSNLKGHRDTVHFRKKGRKMV